MSSTTSYDLAFDLWWNEVGQLVPSLASTTNKDQKFWELHPHDYFDGGYSPREFVEAEMPMLLRKSLNEIYPQYFN